MSLLFYGLCLICWMVGLFVAIFTKHADVSFEIYKISALFAIAGGVA